MHRIIAHYFLFYVANCNERKFFIMKSVKQMWFDLFVINWAKEISIKISIKVILFLPNSFREGSSRYKEIFLKRIMDS